jgi:hypothetical protein
MATDHHPQNGSQMDYGKISPANHLPECVARSLVFLLLLLVMIVQIVIHQLSVETGKYVLVCRRLGRPP